MAKKKKPQPESEKPQESLANTFPAKGRIKRNLVFDSQFLEDLAYWVKTDRKIALRLLSLVEEIGRIPFDGTGKPERLKYQDANVWSRRLTDQDRIVYLVSEDRIEFLQGRYHYSDH